MVSFAQADFRVSIPRTLDFNHRTRAQTMHPLETPDPATGRPNQSARSPRMESGENLESLVRQEKAAIILEVTPRCLENWRHRGGGPNFIRISARCIRYRRSDLNKWIAERVRTSTSDRGTDAA